ncbi:uncharacterized mitochondrial protein AtMg01250-like [Beta vulgaris subsp. vulgaris]|uniref:uncharacterized mitochondrial protein AtMg01250-like n=1 Tax=Beta vulgaris subsp. vulgaris TaxID=3555 RepID=UPI0009017D2B|nr:uncharacterized mitochondrial protein AtMg01250-like [Beta vulgaris subsp. vulgaris]
MICNRLRLVLPYVIEDTQGALVHSRNIVHNIVIVQDLVRHYNRKAAKPICIIKVDMQKADDTVNWIFLKDMLLTLDFLRRFVDLVMECVCTPKFSLMINGEMHDFFSSKRGLRQGDPLSPLLFVICMEYLARILAKISSLDQFNYHPRCNPMKLTHLSFADDLILCSKDDFEYVYLMLRAFRLFSESSGLKINAQKSSFYCCGGSRE